MGIAAQGYIDIYLERVQILYSDVEQWVKPLSTQIEHVQVSEQASGPYFAPCLIINTPGGREIARLEPVGTWILGAEGRVDLRGGKDKVAIVYLKQDGPTTEFFEEEGGTEISRSSISLFKDIEQDGWYWIEDSRRGRARLITQELFRDLVSEVSDYEFE